MRLSKEVIEIMKKLPNQQYRKNIVREMQHRLEIRSKGNHDYDRRRKSSVSGPTENYLIIKR